MRAHASDAIRRRARHWPRAFLRDTHEIFEVPPWPLGWIAVAAILLLAVNSLVTAELGQLDLVTTTQARVLPSAVTVSALPLEGGVIGDVRVHEGQSVLRGDILLHVASNETARAIARLQVERSDAAMDLRRLDTLLSGDPRELHAPADTEPALVERARFRLAEQILAEQARVRSLRSGVARDIARRVEIESAIASTRGSLAQLNRRMAVEERLVERNLVSEVRLHRVRSEVADALHARAELARRLSEADARIASAGRMLKVAAAEFRARTLAERAKATQRFDAASRALALKRRELQALSAPADGYVQGASALAIGSAVNGAQPVLRILPADASIEIEAQVPGRTLRWMVEGQRVRLRLAPFEGGDVLKVDGEVARIGGEAVHEAPLGSVYSARFRIARQSLADPALVAALAARTETPLTVDIQLDARSLLDWLMQTSPLRLSGALPATE